MTTATDPFAKAAEALSGRPRPSRSRATSTPTRTRSARCWACRTTCGRSAAQTVCSFPNDPFEPPRWASMLPGTDALVPPSAFPKDPAVMVTCDVASLDRLGARWAGPRRGRRR